MSICHINPLFTKITYPILAKLKSFFKKEDLKEGDLISFLKKNTNYALTYSDDYDLEEFRRSIDLLKDSIIKNFKKHKQYIENEFDKGISIEDIKPLDDSSIEEVNLTQEEIYREISQDYSEYLGNNVVLIEYLKQLFFDNILEKCIVIRGNNLESSRLIRSNEDLNEGIILYMNLLTKTIHDFLSNQKEFLKRHGNPSLATKKYMENYEYNTIHFPKLMILFSTYLEEEINNNENAYIERLNQDFIDLTSRGKKPKKPSNTLLGALNAYMILLHFDDIIENDIVFFKVDKNYTAPIVEEKVDDSTIYHYKYSFKTKNNMKGTWLDSVSDALKLTGSFAVRLIEHIPRANGGNMTLKDFVAAFLRLRSAINILPNTGSAWITALKNAIYDLDNSDLVEALYNILRILLVNGDTLFVNVFGNISTYSNKSNDVKKGLISAGISLGLDRLIDSDFEIFRDVYNFLFGGDGQVGIWQIENKENRNLVNTDTYSICASIVSAFTTTSMVNYLDTHYNTDGELVVSDIRKTKSLNAVFELKRRALSLVHSTNGYSISYYLEDFNNAKKIIIHFPQKDSTKGLYSLHISTKEKTLLFLGKNLTDSIELIYTDSLGNSKEINIEDFVKDIKDGKSIEENEFLSELLTFIDAQLLLELSLDPNILKMLIANSDTLKSTLGGKTSPLNRLIMAAAKVLGAADINTKYEQYVNSSIDPENIKDFESWFSSKEEMDKDLDSYVMRYLLSDSLGNKQIFINEPYSGKIMVGASMFEGDTIFDDYVGIKLILDGKNNSSTTTNGNGDKLPNNSKAFMDIWQEIRRLDNESQRAAEYTKYATDHLLVDSNNLNSILNITIDSEYNTRYGETKQVSNFTNSELLTHSLLHKFLEPIQYGLYISLPECYADKKKYLNFRMALKNLGIDLFKTYGNDQLNFKTWAKNGLGLNKFAGEIEKTLGNYYKNLLYNLVYDYSRIFDDIKFIEDPIYSEDKFNSNRELIENILFKVEQKLKSMTPSAFIDLAHSRGVEAFEEIHYRPFGDYESGYCTINETVVKAALHTYNSVESITSYLKNATRQYVNTLINNYVIFDVSNPSYKQSIDTFLGENSPWVAKLGRDLVLILAKKVDKYGNFKQNYVLDLLVEDESALKDGNRIIYNPIIEAFVGMHALVDENLRHQLSGTEAFHYIKEYEDLNILENFDEAEIGLIKGALNKLNGELPISNLDSEKITILDLRSIYLYSDIIGDELREKIALQYEKLTNSLLAFGIKAQSKRTVDNPGTIRRYDQGTIKGITPVYSGIIVVDPKALVFDYSGRYGWTKNKSIKAFDGAADIDPFTSIMENYSLEDDHVGDVKKPLWGINVPRLGGKRLVKYAVNTITNEKMLTSENADYSLRKVLKRMTDVKWEDDEIDLVSWKDPAKSYKNFRRIILGSNSLYYRHGMQHYEIKDFGRDEDGTYYTIEQRVNERGGSANYPEVKVYHYFKNTGKGEYEHIKSEKKIKGLETINSVYKLWLALGGMYSESKKNNKNLEYSEASNYAVVNFMINVKTETEAAEKFRETHGPKEPVPLNLTYYYQPLKYKIHNYVIYKSSMKDGYSNVNTFEDFTNPEKELKTVKLPTLKYGVQQDSDHEADEAEVTEMSLVISALDSGGYYHEEVKELYEAIGELTLKAAKVEMNALRKALNDRDFADLYRVVGNTIINNYSERDTNNLLSSIIRNIKKTFNLKENHLNDAFKIPFSDHNVYGQILSTVASILNAKSIKRKYPGLGLVMVPSFGIYLIYEVNGHKMQYKDVLHRALLYYNVNPGKAPEYTGDTNLYHKRIVEAYLKELNPDTDIINWQKKEPTLNDLRNYDPLSKVNVECKYTTANGRTFTENIVISLDTLTDYYDFKLNKGQNVVRKALKKVIGKNEEIRTLEIISTSINRRSPRDLAPARIHLTYSKDNKVFKRNIFDTYVYVNLYKALKEGDTEKVKDYLKRIIPAFLRALDLGKYIDEDGSIYDLKDLTYDPAETIMSNVYASQFGLEADDSMFETESNENYFRQKIDVNKIDSEKYDFDFQLINLNNKNNIYISLSPGNDSEFYSLKKVNYPKGRILRVNESKGNIKDRLYIMDKNNIPLYEIGRSIKAEGVFYNEELNIFEDKDGNPLENRKFYFGNDGNIYEEIIFLNKYKVIPKNGKYSITKFCIDKNALNKCLLPANENESNNASYLLRRDISDIIYSLYNSDKFALLQPAYSIRLENYDLATKIIGRLELKFKESGDENVAQYLEDIQRKVFTISRKNLEVAAQLNTNIKYVRLNAGKPYTDSEIKKIFGDIDDDSINAIRSDILIKGVPEIIIKRLLQKILKIKDPAILNELTKDIIALKKDHDTGKLVTWNIKYLQGLAQKRHVSFLKSKYFTSSRIPAQNLQSFMLMECVGFNGSSTNQCAVSHWQVFLQGSDYDIDKSYMLGLEFDNNGIFIGWSNLFDYSSLETLNASCDSLPLCKNIGITNDNKIKDSFVLDYGSGYAALTLANDIKSKINRTKIIGKILKELYSSRKTNIVFDKSISKEDAEAIFKDIKKHDSYEYPPFLRDKILKNFISTGILRISSKIGNLIPSYTPVEMEDIRETLEKSPKNKELENLNPMNPAMFALLQVINMTGKAVTGISANAQKALYIWRYVALEVLKNNIDINLLRFSKEFKGIEGRWNGEITESNLSFLSDFDLDDELRNRLKQHYLKYKNTEIPVDSVISQVISAATDNAKELILGAINAGTKLAKCHLYLMTLGFDVKDIAAFMFSPLISLIDKITDQNIILDHNVSITSVIDYIREYINNLKSGVDKKPFLKGNVNSFIRSKIEKDLEKLLLVEDLDIALLNKILDDLDTFETVFKGANEFSVLGRGLGINQGIKAVNKDLLAWQNSLKNIITTSENKLKSNGEWDENKIKAYYGMDDTEKVLDHFKPIIDGNFNVLEWLTNENYRKLTEEYYNPLKETVNPFYIFNHTPHFKSMFKVAGYAVFVNNEISIKSRLLLKYSEELRREFQYTPFDYEYKFLGVIDKMLIAEYMTTLGIQIPVMKEWTVFDNNFNEVLWGLDKPFVIKSIYDISSFKKVMERDIIPGLKNSSIPIYSMSSKEKLSLANNDFIKGLVYLEDNKRPFWKLNIDMRAIDSNSNNKVRYLTYKDGLRELFKYKISKDNDSLSIGDLFILYNFVVNANHSGSERLTSIFQDVLSDDKGRFAANKSQLYKYYQWLGEKDNPRNNYDRKGEDLNYFLENYNLLDILMECAPIKTSTRVGGNIPVIRTINPDGTYTFHILEGYNNYVEIPIFMADIPGESYKAKLIRKSNQYKYGYGNDYNMYIKLVFDSFEETIKKGVTDNLVPIWKLLTINGTVNYYLNCV